MFNIQKRARLQQSQQDEFVRNRYDMIDYFDANIPIDQNIDNEEVKLDKVCKQERERLIRLS